MTRILRILQIRAGGRACQVREDNTDRPLGRAGSLVALQPAAEERSGEGTCSEKEPVHRVKGKVREDHLWLALEQISQRRVGRQAPSGMHHACDEDIFEVMGFAHDNCQPGEEPRDLGIDHRTQHRVPAPGKRAVQRCTGHARLTRHVVRGRLGSALAGDAPQRTVDYADPLKGAVVRAKVLDHAEAALRKSGWSGDKSGRVLLHHAQPGRRHV